MQTSRDEYLVNQARALALQEEHQEDLADFDDKLIELEVRVETMDQ